jgi:hypothetical protein
MRDVIYLLFHLLTTLAKLIRPGGGRAVIAENLLLKQQLIIHSRSQQRAPNLTTKDPTQQSLIEGQALPKPTKPVLAVLSLCCLGVFGKMKAGVAPLWLEAV